MRMKSDHGCEIHRINASEFMIETQRRVASESPFEIHIEDASEQRVEIHSQDASERKLESHLLGANYCKGDLTMSFKTMRTVDFCKFKEENGSLCGVTFKVTSGNRKFCDSHSVWFSKEGPFKDCGRLADKYNDKMDNSIPPITKPKIIYVKGRYEPSERERQYAEWREEL